MIVATRLPKTFLLSESTVRRKVKALYAKNSEDYADLKTELKVLGYDERDDITIQAKGPSKSEPHITFTDERDYVDHGTIVGRHTSENTFHELWKIVEKTESEHSIDFLQSDGCGKNTGVNGKLKIL